jgi:DNA-binding CsgD family transcriptional regulator
VLSERETDVARLVVEGKTYAEIGETIFISPRTAEHHIASIRRRLGATSRSDLIAKLRVALAQTRPLAEDG